jgi:phage tail sheath protein FI
MPVSPTYPGVYIEEIPSGNRTIVGVATSITAFVGRTVMGKIKNGAPVPTTCFSYADYERYFGGLSYDYPVSYAVQDFFLNGGAQAIVARAFHLEPGQDIVENFTATFGFTQGPDIVASGPGTWGNNLTISFDYVGLRSVGATPATASVTFSVKAGEKIAAGKIPVTVTPKGGTAIEVDYTATATDTPASVAASLAAAFNANAGAAAVASASASGATVTFATIGVGPEQNSATITSTPDAATNVEAAVVTFAGAAPGNATAATLTTAAIAVPSPITEAGSLSYIGLVGGTSVSATVNYTTTDTAQTVAQKLASALQKTFGGSKGTLKSAVVDKATGTILTLTSSAPGASGNKQLAALQGTAPTGFTVPATLTLAGGVDPGYSLGPAQAAVKPFAQYGVQAQDLFNVTVTYQLPNASSPISVERFANVSLTGAQSPTRIDRVLEAQSLLVEVAGKVPEGGVWGPFSDAVVYTQPGQSPSPIAASGGVDSDYLEPADILGDELNRTGMYALENVDLFNLLVIPPDTRGEDAGPSDMVYAEAAEFCADRRAMLLCDPPNAWAGLAKQGQYGLIQPTDVGVTDEKGGRNAAVFFPRIKKPDLLLNGKVEVFSPTGSIAGQFAQTDVTRGVWKAPAGIETGLEGVVGLEVKMTDDQNGVLNPLGINAIRNFPVIGPVIWGSRTLRGADVFSDDYKYIPVRRLTLYIEESLYRGTKWAVFEPNAEPLWSQLRLTIGTFMADLARQGAFYGYAVTCDKTTTLQSDIDLGIVNVLVAFAPVKPAEFVVLQIAQQAGQTPG